MHIILDFDYTVFDTASMRRRLYQAWESFGVTAVQCRDAERRAIEQHQGLYTLDHHISELFQSSDRSPALTAAVTVLADLSACVYPDVRPWFAHQTGHRVTILSFGDAQWQRQKITASGLDTYVDEVIITQGTKDTWPSQLPGESDILVVDDKAVHLNEIASVCPQAQLYWMQRPGTPHTALPDVAHTAVRSLAEINL